MIGQCFDTIIVASSDKEWLIMTNQNLSLRMCWKLFWATLRAIIWSTLFNYCVQPILENTGLVRLVQVYWSRLRLRPWTLPQGDKTWSKSLAWWKSMYTKTFESKINTCCFWNAIWLCSTSTTTDCSFLKTLLLSGWNAFLCHASILSLLLL